MTRSPGRWRGFNDLKANGVRMAETIGRARTCQYIEGDFRKGDKACGAPVQGTSSYCPEHHAICFHSKANKERSERGKKAWDTRVERYGARGLKQREKATP